MISPLTQEVPFKMTDPLFFSNIIEPSTTVLSNSTTCLPALIFLITMSPSTFECESEIALDQTDKVSKWQLFASRRP